MEKPKFKVPKTYDKRAGRITLFLASVAAVSYLLVRFGGEYASIYRDQRIALPVITKAVLTGVEFVTAYWWAVAVGAVVLTFFLYAVTKSGTIFTILSILVWLVGAATYIALWLPSRLIEHATGG